MRFAVTAITLLALAGLVACQPVDSPTSSKDRKPHPATQPGQVLELSIKELGNFDFDPEAKDPIIPDDVKALSGVTVKLHGYMIPMDRADHIKKFALVPEMLSGDSNPLPLIQHVIVVTCVPGYTAEYCPDEIVVQGKLTVDILKDDGFIVGIFAVEATSVKPVPK